MSLIPKLIQFSSAPPISDRPSRVLLIENDRNRAVELRLLLTNEAYELDDRGDPDDVFEAMESFDPDLILLNADLTGDGFDLCRDIRTDDVLRHTPIMLYAPHPFSEGAVAEGLHAGADEFFTELERRQELLARIAVQIRNKHYRDALRRVRTERDNLRRDVQLDGLTGVLSRRSLEMALGRLLSSAESFAVLFLDIDHFKRVNDTYGHETGDFVLRAVAQTLRAGIRRDDCVGRWGGEEFVLLLPGATREVACQVANRHRAAVSDLRFDQQQPECVTVSVGAAVFDPSADEAPDSLLRRADAALYRAKHRGRNCVVLAAPSQAVGLDSEELVMHSMLPPTL